MDIAMYAEWCPGEMFGGDEKVQTHSLLIDWKFQQKKPFYEIASDFS